MARYWFKWNGTSSTEMGIILNGAPSIIKPEERVEHVTIPGRAGELTVTEGDDIYQSYIQTVGIAVQYASQVPVVEAWLRGDGQLILSSQPGLQQKARVIGAVTLEKHSRNTDWWEGDVQFYCSPIKTDPDEDAIVVTESGATITNPGDMTAFPLIEITGSGAVTISCGGKVLSIPECVSGWTVDSENEWILQGNAPQERACSGGFPVFAQGVSTLAYTGSVTQLTITPRWRYL